MPANTSETSGVGAPGFAAQIRKASWSKHQSLDPSADDSDGKRSPGVFDRLFDGTLAFGDYTRWHAQQYFVYEAVETAAEQWRGHPVAGPFVFDELLRLEALRADLTFLIGPDWRERIAPLASTRRYVDRIAAVAGERPGGYIAHSYTRYLGDLSGGQAFGKAARRLYGFDGPGAAFYDFADIADAKAFKDTYRSRLDRAGLDADEREQVVTEVLVAYDHNAALLRELGAHLSSGPTPFAPEVVAAILRHMNTDHPEDTLVMCRGAGARPTATAARMTGLDGSGGDFVVTVDGTEEAVRLPWAHTLTERAEVRGEVVRIFTESREALRHTGA